MAPKYWLCRKNANIFKNIGFVSANISTCSPTPPSSLRMLWQCVQPWPLAKLTFWQNPWLIQIFRPKYNKYLFVKASVYVPVFHKSECKSFATSLAPVHWTISHCHQNSTIFEPIIAIIHWQHDTWVCWGKPVCQPQTLRWSPPPAFTSDGEIVAQKYKMYQWVHQFGDTIAPKTIFDENWVKVFTSQSAPRPSRSSSSVGPT